MPELHETLMGRKLIEHTLPEIARQLARVADALEKQDKQLDLLKEKYRTLSSLDVDPNSKHRLSIKVVEEMNNVLEQIKKQENG